MRPEKQQVEGCAAGWMTKKAPSFPPGARNGDDPIKFLWLLWWVLRKLLPGAIDQYSGKEISNLNSSLELMSFSSLIPTFSFSHWEVWLLYFALCVLKGA